MNINKLVNCAASLWNLSDCNQVITASIRKNQGKSVDVD